MGDAAVVIGSEPDTQTDSLYLSSVSLDPEPALENVYEQENAVQGEHRSHGFFFNPDRGGGGLLGLPVRTQGSTLESLYMESAEVLFLAVDSAHAFTPIGSLAASNTRVEDACEYSCADWYGNARPIFWRDRIFGLLGYELVEGSITDLSLTELGRANFFTQVQ